MTYIYKYVPFNENSLSILINGQFWTGACESQNDLFEGDFIVTRDFFEDGPDNALVELFYKKNGEFLRGKSVEDKIKEGFGVFLEDFYQHEQNRLKKGYGVSSFTYDAENVLMWANYGDSNRGFCIELDKESFSNFAAEHSSLLALRDVSYMDSLPMLRLIIQNDFFGVENEEEILLSKMNTWKYEQEVRLVSRLALCNQRYVAFEKHFITGIIFGNRMSLKNRCTIKNILSGDNGYRDDIMFYEIIRDGSSIKKEVYNFG